jgi:hypothetical protein
MPQLTPIELEDGTIIYIQASENISTPTSATKQPTQPAEKTTDTSDKLDFITETPEDADRIFGLEKLNLKQQGEQLQKTVQSYSKHIIKSFKDLALSEVELKEVTLEFGVNVGGMTGIPYIVTGNTDCNIKITVKCEFPKKEPTNEQNLP